MEDIHTDIIQNGMTNDTYIKQKNLQNEWEELCGREEEYWRQKSRELWLQQGDKNTKYFHASAQKKRAAKTIFSIKDSVTGNVLTNSQHIKEEGVRFFKNLLAPAEFPAPSPS